MSGEKTEAPTGKRRAEAREKGQVARSQEITSVAVLLAGFAVLANTAPAGLSQLRVAFRTAFESLAAPEPNPDAVLVGAGAIVSVGVGMLVPLVLTIGVVGVVANLAQVGPLLTLKPLSPDFNRINPLKGFARFFSLRSLVETGKSLAKMAIIGFVAYQIVVERLGSLAALQYASAEGMTGTLASIGLEIGQKCVLILGVMAAADYAYQHHSHEKSLKMSKQEVKEEARQAEGDPQLKAKIRQMARQLASRRMMQDVPKADVVVVNPVHFAVALEYKPEKMGAPVVLAKGRELVALQIKKKAVENGVPIVENPPLARALYSSTDIGKAIPPAMYEAVAEVLAFIYRLKGRAAHS